MLHSGLSEDGPVQALGWPKARVSVRMRLLELPARAQELVGAGVTALSAVDQLRAIGQVSPPLLDAVVALTSAKPRSRSCQSRYSPNQLLQRRRDS
jgi:hypothetical protein